MDPLRGNGPEPADVVGGRRRWDRGLEFATRAEGGKMVDRPAKPLGVTHGTKK